MLSLDERQHLYLELSLASGRYRSRFCIEWQLFSLFIQ
jgi:hypothetical protein